MANEKDAATIAAEAKAEKERIDAEFEASLEGLSDEEKTQKRTEKEAKANSQIDYEAELAREKKRGDDAEAALNLTRTKARERFEKKHGHQPTDQELEDEHDEEDVSDEKPLTRKELDAILSKNTQQTRKEVLKEVIAERVRKMSKSDIEAELITEIHKNRVWPANLTLEEQLNEAYVIANGKHLVAQRDEAIRALRGKDGKSTDTTNEHRDSAPLDEPKLASGDMTAMKAAGYKWDGVSGSWKLETKNRVIFVSRDLKTRKVVAK